jgi:hypothetical protein
MAGLTFSAQSSLNVYKGTPSKKGVLPYNLSGAKLVKLDQQVVVKNNHQNVHIMYEYLSYSIYCHVSMLNGKKILNINFKSFLV